MTASRNAAAARGLGAALLVAAVVTALLAGGAGWTVALLGGAGAAIFTLWRTVAGVGVGFAALLAAAWFGRGATDALLPRSLQALLFPLAILEVFGLVTVGAVARARDPTRVSHRLLVSWLASSGVIALGVALCISQPSRGMGSALVAAGLAYRLGTVPTYAWAPLLMRHPAPSITCLGVMATVAAGALLLMALPRLPHPAAAATTVAVLCAATVPWALWHALQQWSRDRRCAMSYASVVAVAELLLVVSRSRY